MLEYTVAAISSLDLRICIKMFFLFSLNYTMLKFIVPKIIEKCDAYDEQIENVDSFYYFGNGK